MLVSAIYSPLQLLEQEISKHNNVIGTLHITLTQQELMILLFEIKRFNKMDQLKFGTIVPLTRHLNRFVSIKKGEYADIMGFDVDDTTIPMDVGNNDYIDAYRYRPFVLNETIIVFELQKYYDEKLKRKRLIDALFCGDIIMQFHNIPIRFN